MMDDDEESRPRTFCVMWDCNGLEAIGEVVDPALKTWAILANKPVPKNDFNLMHWQLRARYNSQRPYEIYLITATPGIGEDDIRNMFEANPQVSADTIRRLGQRVYSDRVQEDSVVIR